MDKTFTDCYLAKGFTGGGWGYVFNSNDSKGINVKPIQESLLNEKDRMLAYYMIGWDSLMVSKLYWVPSRYQLIKIQEHHEYAKTVLFDVEIDKLKPYFGPGTGAFYAKFERHG
jgi:hypothetical protein